MSNCPKCGAVVNEGERFCRNCGAEQIKQPTNDQQINISQNNMSQPSQVAGPDIFNQPAQVNETIVPQNNTIQPVVGLENFNQPQSNNPNPIPNNMGQPIMDQNNNNQQMNNNFQQKMYTDDELLEAFVGNNFNKIITGKFSWTCYFFGPSYIIYRKMYLYGIALVVLNILLSIFLSSYASIIGLVISIVLGSKFNEFYIKHAREEINKIKMENSGIPQDQLLFKVRTKGGTKVWPVVITAITLFVVFFVTTISVLLSSSSKIVCKSPEGNITIHYDEESIISFTSIGVEFDLDDQKKYSKEVGSDKYVREFEQWFEDNTSGSCEINK